MATKSEESKIAKLGNRWLDEYKLPYKLERGKLNDEIDKALVEYSSKRGGGGGNVPDAKLLLQDKQLNYYPIIIEYKGYKNKLVKLNNEGYVDNRTAKNEPKYPNISGYAVNGAIHYANALLHHTSYTDIIAIGMTGYTDTQNRLQHQIGVYYVSKSNLGMGQKVGEYSDFSFLAPEYFDNFIAKVKNLKLTQSELQSIKNHKVNEIDASLKQLNNDIHKDQNLNLTERDRVYLVAGSIIATLGVPNKVAPLEKDDLKSLVEEGNRDADILVRKIRAFLKHKAIPDEKKDFILSTLENTLTNAQLNKVVDGETLLKKLFCKIVDDLGFYYKIGLTTDFTGMLFNEMYSWLGYTQDPLNDVVLTPTYVAQLLVKLARVNKDSYVWDFATGSAGLLVAAMNAMLDDARDKLSSPEELALKEVQIKAEQLLGIEVLPEIYMLAILNMILMGDGSSNILNKNSLTDFKGEYGYGKSSEAFPADVFILNPPYSKAGCGMVFVEHALSMMNKGYAAIIIKSTAGSGDAIEFNKRILEKNTLLASIKMPVDLFRGKSSVQTHIYVFKVAFPHEPKSIVKFIDFSNDGYKRGAKKKAAADKNLKNVDRALERYEELVNLVLYGSKYLEIFTKEEYYEATIDPTLGNDWNQSAPIDTRPTLEDFKKTVSEYLAWEVSNILKNQPNDSDSLGK